MTGSDWATIVYSYFFVIVAVLAGIGAVSRHAVRRLAESITDTIMTKLEPLFKLEGEVESLATRMKTLEHRQDETFELVLKLLPKGKAVAHGTKKTQVRKSTR